MKIDYEKYDADILRLAQLVKNVYSDGVKGVYGIPRGGYYPAIRLAEHLQCPVLARPEAGCLLVDDRFLTGETLKKVEVAAGGTCRKAVVYVDARVTEAATEAGVLWAESLLGSAVMPDEGPTDVERHIRCCLEHIGEDALRPGLVGTPDRIRRMWEEIFRGYNPEQAPRVTVFDNGSDGIVYDGMVVDSGRFNSMCEHHLMPFWGKYWFAYIPHPKGKILGLSKIGRVVDYCAARAQIQERLVRDVVAMLSDALNGEHPALGLALMMKAHHGCKEFRGVKKRGIMTSSYLEGVFKTNAQTRSEFFGLVGPDEDI